MAQIPECPNSLKSSNSSGYCPRSDRVIAWECGPPQATTAYVLFCKTCKLVQYLNTSEYDTYQAKLAIEEAGRQESETERKRRRFSIFFGVRGGASDATRRY